MPLAAGLPTDGIVAPSADSGTCEQFLDDLADLHELVHAGRLVDELGNPEILEQSLVSPGPGRAPHAHGNAVQVFGAADFAQDVLSGVLGQVQVHQDQVWNCRDRVGPLSADEGKAFASVQQVNQLKLEILFLSARSRRKTSEPLSSMTRMRAARTAGACSNIPPLRPTSAGSLHHSTLNGGAVCGTTCLALTIHRLGAGPT